MLPGPALFARYAYGPNRLGLCGPEDSSLVVELAAAGEEPLELRRLIGQFEGAHPYLSLIAAANDIVDPLDQRVVEAYWLGNGLLDNVTPRLVHRSLDDRFRRRLAPQGWRDLERSLALAAYPNHAFHVLQVMPLLGLLREGQITDLLATLDACRIRSGRVVEALNRELVVEVSALMFDQGRLRQGPAQKEQVQLWFDRAPHPLPGDLVSVHWGWACDQLSRAQGANLERWTRAALASTNHALPLGQLLDGPVRAIG